MRMLTSEEREEVFKRLREWGHEGERIVEVHKAIIALLDAKIADRQAGRRV
jgi:hypothetical protein